MKTSRGLRLGAIFILAIGLGFGAVRIGLSSRSTSPNAESEAPRTNEAARSPSQNPSPDPRRASDAGTGDSAGTEAEPVTALVALHASSETIDPGTFSVRRQEILDRMNSSLAKTWPALEKVLDSASPTERATERNILIQAIPFLQIADDEKFGALTKAATQLVTRMKCETESDVFQMEWLSIQTVAFQLEPAGAHDRLKASLQPLLQRSCSSASLAWIADR